MKKNDLTYLQKVALDGEIAFAIATSNHDDEVLFRMYSILTSVDDDIYPYVLDCFEELSNIPVEKIQRVRAEIALGKVPMWIWENKTVSDLKECIKLADPATSMSSTSADNKMLKLKLVESAFIFFIRKVAMLSAQASKSICLKILEEPKLECLFQACSCMLQEIEELPMNKKVSKETFKKLMEEHFDMRDTLSYKLETKALNMLIRSEKEEAKRKPKVELNKESFKNEEMPERQKSFEEIFNEFLAEDDVFQAIFQQANSFEEPKEYIVKKIFKSSGKATTLETFKTKREAESFIKDIITNMPELLQTCTFVIEHQI